MLNKYFLSMIILISIVSFPNTKLLSQEERKIVIISERVGEEIDQEERERFKLFQSINGFQSAVYVKSPDNRYFLEITYNDDITGELKVGSIEQSEASINNRRKYIDNFEELQQSQEHKTQDSITVVYEEPGTAFFLELGGKPFYSINADFKINKSNRFSFGIQPVYGTIIPNLMYYYISGEENSKFEVGGGISYIPVNTDETSGMPVLIHGVLGYRYQKKDGLLFRADFTPIVILGGSGGFLPMFGISFGYSL